MYRIEPTDVDSLVRFGETALRARGVFIRTHDVRPPGTHAVACVVHPLSQDEFHLVGQIVRVPAQDSEGIALQFLEIDEHTESQYRYFVALGISSEDGPDETNVTVETEIEDMGPEGSSAAVLPSRAEEAGDFPGENTMAVGLHEVEIVNDSEVDDLSLAANHEKTERVQRSEFFSDENDESR
jgi:hypothetical protein